MNKKFIIVLGVILSILIILGIVVIISEYKGKGELSIAKNNEIILNETLNPAESLAENDNIIQETEQEITKEEIREETTEDTSIESTQVREIVDNNVKQSTNVGKSEVSRGTTEKKEQTTPGTNEIQEINPQETNPTEEKKNNETQSTPTTQNDLKCVNGHYMEVGNVKEWFDTQDEAMAYYYKEIIKYDELLKDNKISQEEYYQKCPYGANPWDCSCGKWTIDLYYR